MFKYLILLIALLSVPPVSALEKAHIGMNLPHSKDWLATRTFADTMKSSRVWNKLNSKALARVDSKGWPKEDASIYVWHGTKNNHGTYGLRFRGRATVTTRGGNAFIRKQSYNAKTKITTAELVYKSSSTDYLRLQFTKTSGGVKNVELMRPKTKGAATHYPFGTIFTNQIKTFFQRVSVTRYMNFTGVNSSGQVHWSDRTPYDYATQAHHPCARSLCSFEGNGSAFEYAILFSNATDTDMWVNVPMKASNDYITQLAKLIKNGNPKLGVPPLKPGLKVYVELSNEVWNTGKAFYQSKQLRSMSKRYKRSKNALKLNYDGNNNPGHIAWRYFGFRTAQMSNIFRRVFGNSQMMSRIRPVLEGQGGRPDVNLQSLNFIENTMPHPANYYIYGGGGSTYYSPERHPITLHSIWEKGIMNANRWVDAKQSKDVNLMTAFGLKRVAYEGGPDMKNNRSRFESTKRRAVFDPRMRAKVKEMHLTFREIGGDLEVLFHATGDHQWGFVQDMYQQRTPKNDALSDLSVMPDVAYSGGHTLPAVFTGTDADIAYPTWTKGDRKLKAYRWMSYTIRVTRPGTYVFNSQIDGSGRAAFHIDGKKPTIKPVNSQTQSFKQTAHLDVGKHSFRIRSLKSSVVNVKKIEIRRK